MKTKFIYIILAAVAVVAFIVGTVSGVSLSSDEESGNSGKAALIGMFVTKEAVYSRLDAVPEEYTEINDETEEKISHKEYVFKNIEGFPFYHCEIKDSNGNYGLTVTNGVISDVNNIFNLTDTAEENIIKGTLYTTNTNGVFYANPVYQDQDGNVWLEPGDGLGASGYGSASIKLGNEIKVTTGNNVTTKKYEAELKIEYADPVKELIISEMDADDVLIRKTTYLSGDIPAEYKPSDNTDYIIVNTVYYDVENVLQEKRNVYDRTDSEFSYMNINEDEIGIKKSSEIIW